MMFLSASTVVVGKSSLANVTGELLLKRLIRDRPYAKRCDSQDSFETILAEPLKDVGIDLRVTGETKSHNQGGSAGLGIQIVAKGEIASSREHAITFHGPGERLSPSLAADALKTLEGLLVIDEADAIQTAGDKRRVAEFIKLLSDAGLSFQGIGSRHRPDCGGLDRRPSLCPAPPKGNEARSHVRRRASLDHRRRCHQVEADVHT
jgi:hypothetical protein